MRTWNLFHGRTVPEGDSLHLEEMVRRISAGMPDVVCLQEVPVWALQRLGVWSGLAVFGSVAMRALGGPAARRLTRLHPRGLRSALSGQANAILFARRLSPHEHLTLVLNPEWFRRSAGDRLGLTPGERSAWARNRRVAQLIRLEAGGGTLVIVNTHLTSPADSGAADAELARALALAQSFATPGEPIVLCGDLNLTAARSENLAALGKAGYSPACTGIDHIVVRGLELTRGPEPWDDAARRLGDVLLSDHAPLEAAMMAP